MMERCKELFLEDIIRVYPLADGQLQHQLPPAARTDVVAYSQLGSYTEETFKAFIAGKPHFTVTDGIGENYAIPVNGNIQLRDTTEKTRGGYQHTVTCSLTTVYQDESERALVRQMEEQSHDLIVERQDGTLYLVRCWTPAQLVNHEISEEENSHGIQVRIEMKNVTGLQKLVESSSSSE